MNEALFSIDTLGNLQYSSTFTQGTFQLTNNSNLQDIVSITLDLSSAIFPDLVFDPLGNAGDTTAKGFNFDSQNDAGNTIAISNFPYNNAATPFTNARDGGYDVMKIDFDSFQPGQTLKFSVDVDPTSIQGAGDPGPSDSGSVSGLELVGATITVQFADNTELTGQVYRTPGSDVASEVNLTTTAQAAPEIEAIGFDGAATVGDANQTIKITGNPGAEVSLLILEGGLYTEANGGNDIDPFEANRAVAVNEITATIGANGTVDVPVELTYTEVDGSGGLNYIVAKYQDGNSLISDRVVLEYNPGGTTDPGTTDPGTTDPGTTDPGTTNPVTPTPNAEGVIRIEAEDYKAGVNGTEYFDFTPENQSGAYRLAEEVDIETTGDVEGGFNVSFIQDGEFLTYDVTVAEAGAYNIMLRVATPSAETQSAEVSINGETYTVNFDFTGGWQTYQDVLVSNVNLAAGTQELRFDAKSSQFNFNYIELVPGEPVEPVVDTVAPTAVLDTATVSTVVGTADAPTFTVTYSDNNAINAATIDANDLTVTAPDGTEIAVSLVGVDNTGTATYAIAAPGGTWDLAEAGDYTIALKADAVSDANGNTAAAAVLGNLNVYFVEPGEPTTDPGTDPGTNPGTVTPTPNAEGVIRIEAEDYKAGVNGTEYFDFTPENQSGAYRLAEEVDIETTGDVEGGFNVSFIQDGEFLTYDVTVAEAGAYNIMLRVATPSAETQSAEVSINGETYTVNFDFTGGWQTYQDVLVSNVNLAAGTQELRFDAKSSQFNFNYIELVPGEPGEPVVDTTAPTAVLNTATVSQPLDGTNAASFTITYSDDSTIDAATIDANDLTVTAPDGTEMAVSLVGVNNTGTATYAIAAPDGTWDLAEAGDYTVALKAGEVSDTAGNLAAAAVLGTVNLTVTEDAEPPVDPNPVTPGTAETIRIEAEDYNAGINGLTYLDTSGGNFGGAYRDGNVDIETTGDVEGGFNVGWIQAGEFLTYNVDVAEAGSYDIVLRVATPSNGQSIDVTLGGQTVTAGFDFTGGWQTYQDVIVSNVSLNAGSQELRLDMKSSTFNLNYIELVPQNTVVVADETAPTANLDTTVLTQQSNSLATANFTVTYSDDRGVDAATIDANDLTVTAPDGTEIAATLISVNAAGNGTPRTATYAIAAPDGAWNAADAGNYIIALKAGEIADTSGNVLGAGTLGSLTINVPDSVVTEGAIRIEAEDYKAGTNGEEYFDFNPDANLGGAYRPTEGVDIEATGDIGGGFNVAFIQDGEFLTYDVNVPAAGEYNLVLRVAANADTQSLEVVAGGQTSTANFDSTGGWQTYTDVVISNVTLTAGAQELRINAKSNDFNLNYFELIPTVEFVDETAPTATLSTTGLTKQPDSSVPANFTVNFADNVGIDAASIDSNDVTVTDSNGTMFLTTLVGINNNSNGSPESATYYFDAPGGTWDAADIGNYTVSLNAGEVADTSGNVNVATNLGSFGIDVSAPVDDGVIRINAGATVDGVDTNNKLWLADLNFAGGQASTVDNAIANTDNDFIYQSQRSANNFAYSIPVANGNYSIKFHLAELDHNGAGARRFDVALEGEQILDDYDIWQSTKNAFLEGSNTAKVVQVADLVIARDGAIDLDFTSEIGNATIAGIEIAPIEGAQVLIQESNADTVVVEGGAGDTYEVLLNTQPTADVTINLQPDDQTDVNQNTLVFTPQNWNVPQTVTVNAVDDNAGESQHISTIAHNISSADANYNGLAAPSVTANVIDNDNVEIRFDRKDAASPSLATVATWGPDGRLYVGSYLGNITAYTFDDNYNVVDQQSVGTIGGLSNKNITGIAFNPHDNDGGELKLYVSHNQFRANQESFDDHDFDENTEFSPYSGQVSVLSGANFENLTPVVQNIGVSNHDHGVNGLAFDNNGDLLITVGSKTNVGIADDRIGGIPESPFTVAILKAEITKPDFNGNIQYELPADWVAPEGFSGEFNPADSQGFGGDVNVVPGVDVSIYASGLRNAFDLVYATNGNIYATENGANSNFGDVSTSATTQEPFNDNPLDELNLIQEGSYYGQPNRNRGRDDDRQNRFYSPDDASNGEYTAPIAQFKSSTNGLAEYRSTAFGSQLRGNLLAQNLDPGNGAILYNVDLSGDGSQVLGSTELETQGGSGIPVGQGVDVLTGFSGAILSTDFYNGKLRVATPIDNNITTATAYEIDEWRAPASGGGTFTIGGINFSELNDTTVTIGNEAASIISVSDKRIFGTLPAFDAGEYASEGLLDITVASGNEVSTITDAFQPLFV